ncbi:RNase H domain-containing protein [Trichonephila clavipes]|uniref:RNase H domain-containing protein n=1 Tax=Trichonephila clavipes TaxID=2585209 RepID=A0A8X6SUJ9_TRICX|nr:RNase H domain-containing protein [Trichonephila clavipes]
MEKEREIGFLNKTRKEKEELIMVKRREPAKVRKKRLPHIDNGPSDLEYLGITVHSKDRTITIKNLYPPPNSQHLDTNMMEGKKLCRSQTIKLAESLCEKLDYRTSNTKLGKLAKQIDNLKPSNEETNAIISGNGHISMDAQEAAEALAQHYAKEGRLAFSSSDKHFAKVTRNQTKSCRDRPADDSLFNADFTFPELSYGLQNLDTNKSPDPDSIPGHFLCHFGILGRERLLYTYVTCHGKLANYQDSGNQPSLFPFINQQECRSYDKLSSYFSYLNHFQNNGMHGAAKTHNSHTNK